VHNIAVISSAGKGGWDSRSGAFSGFAILGRKMKKWECEFSTPDIKFSIEEIKCFPSIESINYKKDVVMPDEYVIFDSVCDSKWAN